MPEITRQELKDKYPIMYNAFKTAEDFGNSAHKLLPEFEFIVKTCEDDESRKKEMALRIAIYAGVMKKMVELTEKTLEFYKREVKRYEDAPKREDW